MRHTTKVVYCLLDKKNSNYLMDSFQTLNSRVLDWRMKSWGSNPIGTSMTLLSLLPPPPPQSSQSTDLSDACEENSSGDSG
ncbi:hypothetical protein RRG08_036957 [Elysia crispata]|uniref:Uncharacterized protein n=1 Tax=Elysia crispata TaxID=231223 RepID=A0AAE1D6J4_9GAST|nr:hypothetical protein RRG08_036957 [Elysia crispata]